MPFTKTALNYAQAYQKALAQAYPYVLYFSKLRSGENDSRYKFVGGKTIQIPSLKVKGRVDADRDTIAAAARNYNNAWEPKTLSFFRCWSTLVHPEDIDQTNVVASIGNITKVFNEEEKFPEKDRYLIHKLYSEWTDATIGNKTADTTVLTAANIFSVIDGMQENMTEARVPIHGRLLYATPHANTLLKSALTRKLNATDVLVQRQIANLDNLEVVEVPSDIMKTKFTFTEGSAAADDAQQVNLFMAHPSAIITPEVYHFAGLDEPSAKTGGKYLYYEESDEDVFLLKNRAGGLAFNVTA